MKTEYHGSCRVPSGRRHRRRSSVGELTSGVTGFFRGRTGARLLLVAGCALSLSLFSPYLNALNAISHNEHQNFIVITEDHRAVQSPYGLSENEILNDIYSISSTDCAFVLTITDAGIDHTIIFGGGTVSRALEEAGLEPPDSDDIVTPALDQELSEGQNITVDRVTYEEYVAIESIPFETVKRENPDLKPGDGSIITLGSDGEKRIVYQRKWVNGKHDSDTVVSETVTREPIKEIVEVGKGRNVETQNTTKRTTVKTTTAAQKPATTTRTTTAASSSKTTATTAKTTASSSKTTATTSTTAKTTAKTTASTSKTTASETARTTTTVKRTEGTTSTATTDSTTVSTTASTTTTTTSTAAPTTATTTTAAPTTKTTAAATEPAYEPAPPVEDVEPPQEQTTDKTTTTTKATTTTTTTQATTTTTTTTAATTTTTKANDKVFTDSSGKTVSYSKKLTGKGTAYTEEPGSLTASGKPVGVGLVAVNPSVIPYGTRLYIVSADGKYTYGYATAADTGGALRSGKVIVDLFYDTESQCNAFGRRDVIVYVL